LSNDKKIAFDIKSEKIELNINQAIPCSLIINEVVTNIYKHAFPKAAEGKVRIKLTANGDDVLLTVSDNGCGLPENYIGAESGSLGLNIIKVLSNQLA
jgi:two-component sensor histidine kinase